MKFLGSSLRFSVVSSVVFPLWGKFQRMLSSRRLSSMTLQKSTICDKVLIVGLGNIDMPHTRHSVGMQLIDVLRTEIGACSWSKDKDARLKSYTSNTSLYDIPDEISGDRGRESKIILLKSVLPMNLNGESVKRAVDHFNIPHENIFVIHDDLDKPVGEFGFKNSGSARGHNGVKSVINCISSDVFTRLRIGIDRPLNRDKVSDYVLSKFCDFERAVILSMAENALALLMERVEKQLNRKPSHRWFKKSGVCCIDLNKKKIE